MERSDFVYSVLTLSIYDFIYAILCYCCDESGGSIRSAIVEKCTYYINLPDDFAV